MQAKPWHANREFAASFGSVHGGEQGSPLAVAVTEGLPPIKRGAYEACGVTHDGDANALQNILTARHAVRAESDTRRSHVEGCETCRAWPGGGYDEAGTPGMNPEEFSSIGTQRYCKLVADYSAALPLVRCAKRIVSRPATVGDCTDSNASSTSVQTPPITIRRMA